MVAYTPQLRQIQVLYLNERTWKEVTVAFGMPGVFKVATPLGRAVEVSGHLVCESICVYGWVGIAKDKNIVGTSEKYVRPCSL